MVDEFEQLKSQMNEDFAKLRDDHSDSLAQQSHFAQSLQQMTANQAYLKDALTG